MPSAASPFSVASTCALSRLRGQISHVHGSSVLVLNPAWVTHEVEHASFGAGCGGQDVRIGSSELDDVRM